MGELSLTDQEAAILVEALSELSRRIKVGTNFTYQYNSIEGLLQRIEATTGKTRQELGLLGWRTPPASKMLNDLGAIEDELNSDKTDN